MKDPFQDETLLARYASGQLSAEELTELRAWEGFALLDRILAESAKLEAPAYQSEAQWETLQKKRVRPGRRLPVWLPYGLAAGIALLLGWFFFQPPSTATYSTGIAEQAGITLPDGSVVQLNERSELHYSLRNWEQQRILKLSGAAFFQVEKGAAFRVETSQGNVEVLGTSFLVQSQDDKLRVRCYTGMVSVTGAGAIVPGEAVEVQNGQATKRWTLSSQDPPDLNEAFTRFQATPLSLVMEEIAWRFEVNVELPETVAERLFSGQILHQDLDIALKMVTEPMNLGYRYESPDRILIFQE